MNWSLVYALGKMMSVFKQWKEKIYPIFNISDEKGWSLTLRCLNQIETLYFLPLYPNFFLNLKHNLISPMNYLFIQIFELQGNFVCFNILKLCFCVTFTKFLKRWFARWMTVKNAALAKTVRKQRSTRGRASRRNIFPPNFLIFRKKRFFSFFFSFDPTIMMFVKAAKDGLRLRWGRL